MHYGMLFLTGQGAQTAETGFFPSFSANPLWPVFWLCIFVAISCIIVMFGVKKGIERTSKIFSSRILIVLNIAIAIYVSDIARGTGWRSCITLHLIFLNYHSAQLLQHWDNYFTPCHWLWALCLRMAHI